MIKRPDFPGNGVVAGVAAFMKIAIVRVVLKVAGNTIAVFVAERLRSMTIFAFVLVVQTKERKAREIVIEKYRIFPVNFRVATSTA